MKTNRFVLTAVFASSALMAADATNGDKVYDLEDFEVVTTGTRTERLITEVPIKTELLNSSLLENTASFELGQAIELLNGARTENNCQNCGTSEVQLLGLPGSYNQILIDGQPLFTGVASVYGIDQVPTILVDRIEVVKGGGSALYGPGAVAGVINLIPEEPFAAHNHATFDLFDIDGSSAFNTQFASYYVSEDRAFKLTGYGQYSDYDAYDANGDGFTELSERENTTLGTYMWYHLSDDSRLRFNYQYLHEDRRGGDQLSVPEHEASLTEAIETDYHWGSVRFETQVSEDFDYSLSAAMVSLRRDSYYGGTGGDPLPVPYGAVGTPAFDEGDPRNFYGELDSFVYYLEGQFNYYIGDWMGEHTLSFGFQYEDETLEDDRVNFLGEFVSQVHDADYSNFGVYAQDQWEVNDRFELVPGIRIDKAETLDDPVISPRIAARYNASDEWTLRGNFSTGFLAPRVFNEDLHIESLGGTPREIISADDLEEERSYTFALGADYTPQSLEGRVTTSLQTYYTILEDSFFISEEPINPGEARENFLRTNSEGSTIFGLEWDLSWALDDYWSINSGLAYSQTRYDEEQDVFGVLTDKYNKTPDWTGNLQLDYDNPELFDAFLTVLWTGEMEVASETQNTVVTTDDFFVVNVGISRKFALTDDLEIKLRAGVNNLFDDYQDDFESGVDRDPGYVYGPRQPRSFYLGAKVDF